MKAAETKIPGVFLLEPTIFEDKRGRFFESYSKKAFSDLGISGDFVQDNQSRSLLGTLRGLHYQMPPHAQAKLVRVLSGKIFDVAVDIRRGSKTFGQWVGEYLDAEKGKMIYIPVGFAHGFVALEEGTEVLYKVTDFYSPAHERGIVWNDPDLNIAWPKQNKPFVMAEKDLRFPRIAQAELFSSLR